MTVNIEFQPKPETCPAGFVAAAATAGLKPSGKPDLALILCPDGGIAAGMFTRNLICAAPVTLTKQNLQHSHGRARAVLINAGCANAATGDEGMRRAKETINTLSQRLQCDASEILVNSTGVIGIQLATEKITAQLDDLIQRTDPNGLNDVSHAIMTTDTVPKTAVARWSEGSTTHEVVGIAKGSGMIHPDMATMIAVLLISAEVDAHSLNEHLHPAVDASFHRITVDGDTSTNDSVFALASGKTGAADQAALRHAITGVSKDLAIQIVRDGEGAQHVIHVYVEEAATRKDALQVAKTVAMSMLVRTAVAGGDPNWGRIVAAAGRAGVDFDPQRLTVLAEQLPIFENGSPSITPLHQLEEIFSQPTISLRLRLGRGTECDEFHTCDLTQEYVRINSEYTT